VIAPRLLRRILIRTALIPLVLAFLLSGVFLGQVHHLLGVTHWVESTDRVLADASRLEKLLVDMETGLRGYLVAGETDFLDPYTSAGAAIEGTLASLKESVKDDGEQVERLARVRQSLEAWRAYAEGVRRLRDAGGDYRSLVLSRRGKQLMDRMRGEMNRFTLREQQLRDGQVRQARSTTAWVTGTSLGFAALMGGLLAFLMPREIRLVSTSYETALREREAAETELKEANANLERRVEERTRELQQTNSALERENRERRRAEAELRDLTDRLRRSNRELEEFANVASHDLQEPLRKIQAFGDRLKARCSEALPDDGRDYLERMQSAAGRMQTLIQDLLSFSRVTTKAQPFERVELAAVAADVVSDLEARLESTAGRVEIGPLCTLDADPLQMRQLLQNLIGNALKFHRPGIPPEVRLWTEEADGATETVRGSGDGNCTIYVEDNGIGFDEKYLDRIFVPFQRLHERSIYEGTGIGLAICRKIVERHGGSLTARSTPGEGARFIVTLPRCQPKKERAPCPVEDSASVS
jgi:signal transduction histidine kinase